MSKSMNIIQRLMKNTLGLLRKDKLPAIGTKVRTLIPDFSGPAGVTRYVVKHDGNYVHLAFLPYGESRDVSPVTIPSGKN